MQRCAGTITLGLRLAIVATTILAIPGRLSGSATVIDLNTFSGMSDTKSLASFINNQGDVAGTWFNGSVSHAFFYSGITMTATDLGTFGGTYSAPAGLNALGQVTGYADLSVDGNPIVPHAFLYTGGTMTDLGTLGGADSFGDGLNDAGKVVGRAFIDASNVHATLWNGTPTDMGTLGGSFGDAQFINNSGQIAGVSNAASGGMMAFYSADGTSLVPLSLGGSSSSVYAINSSGEVVGKSALAQGGIVQHGFVYTPGLDPTLVDIGTLNGYAGASDAEDINDAGVVVGQSDIAPGQHHAYAATLVDSTWIMTDLGTLNNGAGNSTAVAVNKFGEIVGTASGPNGTVPFIYMDGRMIDLNSLLPAGSGFTQLLTATGINDSGIIIGQGITTAGVRDAYVLISSATQIPEPSSAASMLIGVVFCGVGIVRRHSRGKRRK